MKSYSRTLIPLLFYEENEEITVRNINTLKRFWNSTHLEKLIEYLHDGSLERFFFALRKDSLTHLIAELKSNGIPELDILNRIGSQLGFDPITTEKIEKEKFIKDNVSLKEILCQKGDVKLLPGEWRAENLDVSISEPLAITGSGKEKTLLYIDKLNICAQDKLIFEGLTFKLLKATAEIKVKSGEVLFKDVDFSGIKLIIEGGKVITEDCVFENLPDSAIEIEKEGHYESRGKIEFINIPPESQIRVLGFDIRWEKDISLQCDKREEIYSKILKQTRNLKKILEKTSDNKSIFISLPQGTYDLDKQTFKNKKVTLKGEGEVLITGLFTIESSEIVLENIKFETISVEKSRVLITKCAGKHIYGKNSQITIENSEIHENKSYGIMVKDNSTLKIDRSKIYENGRWSPQICVSNSTVEINSSQIYNSKGGQGIKIHDSQITILGSKIYKNGDGISQVDIYGQSVVKIKDTEIFKCLFYGLFSAHGIYIDSATSVVELENVKTWSNVLGLRCKEKGTKVIIKNCTFEDGTSGV
ncbi:hypothetical protein DRJ19_01960 [Candidatus Woesearchaeota archaeon]|nr:MAG: hypothetical protein DRJ19_01960 [Candidatus Woesearchaeota archaeon]